jgi:cell division septal protein FtsQ
VKRLLILLFLLVALAAFVFYTVKTAPSRLSQVELQVVERHGNWKDRISQFVVSVVRPGQSISPELLEELKGRIEELPWVKRAELSAKGSKLTVKIWEATPRFYVAFNGDYYLIGNNDFVLSKEKRPALPLTVYYYRGKTSPFTVEKGFLKLKKTVKMEIKLANNRIKELSLAGEPPQVILTDTYVTLVFRRGKVIVHLGSEENAWEKYQDFVSRSGNLRPGVYDFRFYDMLITGRNR